MTLSTAIGFGIGIAIGIDHKVKNIYFKRIYRFPTATATPIPKGFCYQRDAREKAVGSYGIKKIYKSMICKQKAGANSSSPRLKNFYKLEFRFYPPVI